jgi:hypothetical protein
MKKTKLKLTRQTVRILAKEPLAGVHGGVYIQWPTRSCYTFCCVSVFESCNDTACCLEKP